MALATRGRIAVAIRHASALLGVDGVEANRVILVSTSAGDERIRNHLSAGGMAAVAARDRGKRVIVLIEGDRTIASVPEAAIPELSGKPSRQQLESHLLALGLANVMGLKGRTIESALTAPPSQPVRSAAE